MVMTFVASSDEIVLTSGETLQGSIVARTELTVVFDHAILGMLEIQLSGIDRINNRPVGLTPETRNVPPKGETPPAKAEKVTPPPMDAPDPNPPTTTPPDPVVPAPALTPDEESAAEWDSSIEFGLNGSQGSTETANVRAAFNTSRTTPVTTLRLDATYRMATTRGDRTEQRFTAGAFHEWKKKDSSWTAFAQGRVDADEFQPWDVRLTFSSGFGYVLVDHRVERDDGKSDNIFKLTARGGAGVRQEFGALEDDFGPEGLLGADFQYALNDRMRLAGGSTLYPDVRDLGEFRIVSNVDVTVALEELEGINMRLGISNEYETLQDDSFDRSDFSAYAAVVVKF